MSDFFLRTGESRQQECKHCKTQVTAHLRKGAAADVEWWDIEHHDAPCGLQCYGGGVHGARVVREGWFHKSSNCPTCTPESWRNPWA